MKRLLDNFTKKEILELSLEFKKRRKYLGISQLKLARLANISQSIINKLENGKIDPTYSSILKIENALEEQEKISNKKAKDIMVKDIFSITSSTKISRVIEIMEENDFSQLLVTKNNEIMGTIYEKSILKAIKNKVDIYNESIKDLIEAPPIIVPLEFSVPDLSYIFQNRKNRLVIVGKNNELQGIITKSDLFKTNYS